MWIAAVIGAVVGAAAGAASWIYGNYKNQQRIDAEKKRIREKGRENLELMDMQWGQSVKNANKIADKSDVQVTLDEAMLGRDVSGQLRGLGAQQEIAALGYNRTDIEAGSAEGAAQNTIAQGGTRGSSTLQAQAMQSELTQKELQAQEDYDRLNGDLTLMSAMNSVVTGAQNMQERRTDAREMREDYAEGGDQWNAYQKSRTNYQHEIDRAVDALDEQMIDTFSGEWFLNAGLALLGGGTQGMKIGSQVGSYVQNWSSPNATDITAKNASVFGGKNNALYSNGSYSLFDANSINFGNIAPIRYNFKLQG